MKDVVSTLNAKPETVEVYLKNNSYEIPDYQRPYSWRKEECIRLWEDIVAYYEEENKESPYFLGNTIVYSESGRRIVVDGQQRLITLMLLAKAVEGFVTVDRLSRCLYVFEDLEEAIKTPKQLRIEHKVLGDQESDEFEAVMLDKGDVDCKNSVYAQNYHVFKDLLKRWFSGWEASEKKKFVQVFLENILLLPIECTNLESSLVIFETINDRGMDLSDEDIFKAKLYKQAIKKNEGEEFICEWDDIVGESKELGYPLKSVFTHYMHVLRGLADNAKKIEGLRKFFNNEFEGNSVKDWRLVVESLKKLIWAWDFLNSEPQDDDISARSRNYFRTLFQYPNDYWQYPVMVYMYKNIAVKEDGGEFFLDDQAKEYIESVLEAITKYYYAKWIKHRGVNAVKHTTYLIVADLAQGNGHYRDIISKDLKGSIFDGDLKRELKNDNLGKGEKGLCMLLATIHEKQKSLLPKDVWIEHILPKKYEVYKNWGWTEDSANSAMSKIGNLVLLDAKLNRGAQNSPFGDKKKFYEKSSIQVAKDLEKISDWSIDTFENRHTETTDTILGFLSNL